LKNVQFCSSSRKRKILTTGIQLVFRGLKFETNAEIGQKGMFFKGLAKSRWTLATIPIACFNGAEEYGAYPTRRVGYE
jgi:hypothetical protein